MKNKEQVLYFFLTGKISLSQYDYKFMANLQTMIQNQNRVTSNQATLFDNLISKYKKQLYKHNLDKEELKSLPWKTLLVDSTPEYTGATISIVEDEVYIRVPFNKTFIQAFRNVPADNPFFWDKDKKLYVASFSTTSFKLATSFPNAYFPSMKLCEQSQTLLDEINKFDAKIWKPTLTKVNGRLMVAASNEILNEQLSDIPLKLYPKTLFQLSLLGISVDQTLLEDNPKLQFASSLQYEIDLADMEQVVGWMKNIGCDNVVIGRGIRSTNWNQELTALIEKYGMRSLGPMSFGKLPEGITMLMQHTSSIEVRNAFSGAISKTIVIKDSRPVEVK